MYYTSQHHDDILTEHSSKVKSSLSRGVQVIFLHRSSASKDGTEQDGEWQQRQLRKKMQRGVLSGQEKQAGVVP